jgi:uridine kinase
MSRCFVIGIAGGSGSGKSTLVTRIVASRYGSDVAVLPHDVYYHNAASMPAGVRGNWDHPDALDNTLFVTHLDALRHGEVIEQPVYDFATHSRSDRTVRVGPGRVIVAEGILLFAIPEVVKCLDLRVFVDTPAEERLIRRLKRDVDERGRSSGSVIEQFRSSVRPMHDQFVEPSRVHAHLIVPWDFGPENTPAVDVLLARIGQILGR